MSGDLIRFMNWNDFDGKRNEKILLLARSGPTLKGRYYFEKPRQAEPRSNNGRPQTDTKNITLQIS